MCCAAHVHQLIPRHRTGAAANGTGCGCPDRSCGLGGVVDTIEAPGSCGNGRGAAGGRERKKRMIRWEPWELQLITPAQLQHRLRQELAASLACYQRYRAWLLFALAAVDDGLDPNMVIAEWSRIRPRPWTVGGRGWWWPRRPTDAVVMPASVLGDA